jgi:hypothetical protein
MATLTENEAPETPVIQTRKRKRQGTPSDDNTEDTSPKSKFVAQSEETDSNKSEADEDETPPGTEETGDDEPDGKDDKSNEDLTTPSKSLALTGRKLFDEDSTDGGEEKKSKDKETDRY